MGAPGCDSQKSEGAESIEGTRWGGSVGVGVGEFEERIKSR
jgi:hypothetical protein